MRPVLSVISTKKSYFGKAFETQFKRVFLAPCFHFSAFISFEPTADGVAAAALSREPTEPLIPWPKYSSARLFSSIYLSKMRISINVYNTKFIVLNIL